MPGFSYDGTITLSSSVRDLDAGIRRPRHRRARAELEAKGVRFDGDTVEVPGMVKLATFFDPDGNRYMFAQSLTKEG